MHSLLALLQPPVYCAFVCADLKRLLQKKSLCISSSTWVEAGARDRTCIVRHTTMKPFLEARGTKTPSITPRVHSVAFLCTSRTVNPEENNNKISNS
uniref:Putative secreted protein n=1 Tax=Anopheles marajoara TaxID=58244 RepID=A0A2M4C947_9DIPT